MKKGEIYWGKEHSDKTIKRRDRNYFHPILLAEDVLEGMDHFKAFILTSHPKDDSCITYTPLDDCCLDTNFEVHSDAQKHHAIIDFGYVKTLAEMSPHCVGKLTAKGMLKLDEILQSYKDEDFHFIDFTVMKQNDILKKQLKGVAE